MPEADPNYRIHPETLVVVSHYDQRSTRDLIGLLETFERHDAGSTFDLCIVVNKEGDGDLNIPAGAIPATVLPRANEGMNIGAWDHGWRRMPGYTHYVFLQDECRIRRRDWLRSMLQRLSEPGVGMVGESVNHRWGRSWADLTRDNGNGPNKDAKESLAAERARLCLRFLQERNIPAGTTARHLRSLVWATTREILERMDGFPIGKTYDECIAAEIAVSRQIEAFGLSIAQAHRVPFYYIRHKQWVNTHPGFSASLTYAEWLKLQAAKPTYPFLSFAGTGAGAARADQLVKRADTERSLFDTDVVPAPECGMVALLVLLVDRAPTNSDLALTVKSWCLQSAPHADLLLVATDTFLRDRTAEWASDPEHDFLSHVDTCMASDWHTRDLDRYEYLVFGRPGDQFHPSLVSVLAILNKAEQPDIVIWNELRRRPGEPGEWLVRQPRFARGTVSATDRVGMAFAVRPRVAQAFPGDFIGDILSNGTRQYLLWLSQSESIRWHTHPEFLSVRVVADTKLSQPSSAGDPYRFSVSEAPPEIAREAVASESGLKSVVPGPWRRANSISVIVSFRDRPQETIACLRSLLGQQTQAHLEIVLINNLSTDESAAEVRNCAEDFRRNGADIKIIEDHRPFNHSRQTNLGARAASGEVLVFFNNDAEMVTSGVLDEMARWALAPGVASVGCQILDHRGELVCAGIRAREAVPASPASPVEESREAGHRDDTYEVVANTFACAAISRTAFEAIGSLNESEFPNGYNDVEYCLRSRRQGYKHVYLGHLQVRHEPGTSRGRCDESLQKILLRQRYPELAAEGMYQFSSTWRPLEVIAPEAGAPADPPLGLKKALKVLYRAIIYWVQRRIL